MRLGAVERLPDELEVERDAQQAEGVRLMLEALEQYRELGMRVEIITDDRSCSECRKFAGHTFDARTAPVLPYASCRNDYCRCDYLPVLE